MPAHFVQEVETAYAYPSVPATMVSPSITLTTGNTVVVILRTGNAGGGASLTDTLGNTYSRLVAGNVLNQSHGSFWGSLGEIDQVFFCKNCIGGTTQLSANIGVTGTYGDIYVLEYSGCDNVIGPGGWVRGAASSTANFSAVSQDFGAGGSGSDFLIVGIASCDNTGSSTGISACSLTRRNAAEAWATVGDQAASTVYSQTITTVSNGGPNDLIAAVILTNAAPPPVAGAAPVVCIME